MFGFTYVKASPTAHIIQYKNGKPVRDGDGLAFWFFAPTTSLVSIPIESTDSQFIFREVTSDFQDVTIQGQIVYRVTAPQTLATLMNFTIKPDGSYTSEDPTKLPQRVVNAIQVQIRAILQTQTLENLLHNTTQIAEAVREGLQKPAGLPTLGLSLVNLSILAIKPNPETARALEAKTREQILKQADDATYTRRNAAIQQERAVKENELNTEIAVVAKKRQIRETQLEAEQAELTKRQQINGQQFAGLITQEKENEKLTGLKASNAKIDADAKSYALTTIMKAIEGVDPTIIQALTLGQADPATIIAQAFQGLAQNAQKIGELNISPDLLQQLTQPRPKLAKA